MKRGIALLTYNRAPLLKEFIQSVVDTAPDNTRIVVCDDGSTDDTPSVIQGFDNIIYIRGPNLGVAANKNRALFSLQDCHFIAMIEDDLFPQEKGWFEKYEEACLASGIHHFCRVQDKEVEEEIPEFTEWFVKTKGSTPVYGPNPRGDFTFISSLVVREVGAFNPRFKGAGYAHGEWSGRVIKAGLVPHPLKWIDIKEARDIFIQKGDTEGGRWLRTEEQNKDELKANAKVKRQLSRKNYIYCSLELP